ncbi:MAG: nucleotidyl transferase AbiEii/AbiGii toxin family protein, partial [Propionibacteriaceae bacterium]|nr:nucleotidyl transferase AbiEii/AbiGii toxin family protein [Propionibacteriaceae bacterium]
ERTFWEKLTLAHADSRRPEFKNSERLSRHWYDLARLARHDIAERALADWDLLEDVIRVKQLYFRTSYADYGLCLSGGARLLPDAAGLQMLRRDYEQMVRAEMIDDPLEFDDIVSAVGELQRRVNAAAVDRTVRPVAR